MTEIVTTVARTYRFRAFHSLPDFPEPWCHLHAHDYTVEVVCKGGTDTDLVDRCWTRVADRLRVVSPLPPNLNDYMAQPTTVENLARYALQVLCDTADLPVLSVTVWEDQARWGKAEFK